MSDNVQLLPLLAWMGAVGIQIGTAIRDVWKSQQMKKEIESERQDLIDRQNRSGWRLAIPAREILEKNGAFFFRFPYRQMARPMEDDESMAKSQFSLLITTFGFLRHTSTEDTEMVQIHRYSLVTPRMKTTLLKIVYDGSQWWPTLQRNFGRRSLVVGFRQRNTNMYRFVICDAFIQKVKCIFDIRNPINSENASVKYAFYKERSKPRMVILFEEKLRRQAGANGEWLFEFHLVAYEIPNIDDDRRQLQPTSWETISIPGGDREYSSAFFFNQEIVTILHQPFAEEVDGYLCVSFDGENWRMEKYRNWQNRNDRTTNGARMLNVFQSVDALTPARWWGTNPFGVPAISYMSHLVENPYMDLLSTYHCVYVRPSRTPSLRFLAAKKLFESYPNLNRDQLKNEIGFDIFDEFPIDNNDVPFIHLLSDRFDFSNQM